MRKTMILALAATASLMIAPAAFAHDNHGDSTTKTVAQAGASASSGGVQVSGAVAIGGRKANGAVSGGTQTSETDSYGDASANNGKVKTTAGSLTTQSAINFGASHGNGAGAGTLGGTIGAGSGTGFGKVVTKTKH